MVIEGSIGTPTFRQIVMQKQIVQEGVKIIGYGKQQKEDGTSKERKQ